MNWHYVTRTSFVDEVKNLLGNCPAENCKAFVKKKKNPINLLAVSSNIVVYSHNKYAYINIYMFMQDTY